VLRGIGYVMVWPGEYYGTLKLMIQDLIPSIPISL